MMLTKGQEAEAIRKAELEDMARINEEIKTTRLMDSLKAIKATLDDISWTLRQVAAKSGVDLSERRPY